MPFPPMRGDPGFLQVPSSGPTSVGMPETATQRRHHTRGPWMLMGRRRHSVSYGCGGWFETRAGFLDGRFAFSNVTAPLEPERDIQLSPAWPVPETTLEMSNPKTPRAVMCSQSSGASCPRHHLFSQSRAVTRRPLSAAGLQLPINTIPSLT